MRRAAGKDGRAGAQDTKLYPTLNSSQTPPRPIWWE